MLQFLLLLAMQDAPPVGQLTLEGGARVTRVTTLRAQVRAVPPGSGALQMALSSDPKVAPEWVPFAESAIVELPAGDGEKKVTLRLKDAKGSESAPVEAVIRLDTTPPTASVKAPERVKGSSVRALFDVSDAVALQYTEDLSGWSSWEPYSTPRMMPLSKGPGKKLLFVRFRDEAGNESTPAIVIVEAQEGTAVPDSEALRDVRVGVQRELSGSLRLNLWIDGAGLSEARVVLDGAELQPRGPRKSELTFDISAVPGPRRVIVETWDASGAIHLGEAVFQDRDASAPLQAQESESAFRPGWNAALKAGVLPSGVKFDSSVATGKRTIKAGPMAAMRLEGGYDFGGIPFIQGSFEIDEGQDLSVLSVGVEVGLDFALGRVFETDLRGVISAGGFVSRLDCNTDGFGDFKTGYGARLAAGVQARLSEQLWVDATVDFRFALWDFDDHVLRGDESARMLGPGILAGLSWRF